MLFDALEEEWAGTELQSVIADLYQGELLDYVYCTECKNESVRKVRLSREAGRGAASTSNVAVVEGILTYPVDRDLPLQDKFMDVPLVIKPFGAEKVMRNADESLRKFIEVERLEVRVPWG